MVEEALEEPGQGGVDAVSAATERGEQPDFGGAIEEADGGLAGEVADGGQVPICFGIAHCPQHVHIHEALEEVEEGELLAFGFAEGVGKAIAEGGTKGFGASLCFVVGEGGFARCVVGPRRL